MPKTTAKSTTGIQSAANNAANKSVANERVKSLDSLLPIRNGMTPENRKAVIDILNRQNADHYVLVTKTKFYHWNVEGPEFVDIHELLDDHYEILSDVVDQIAEQALKLGGQAAGTLEYFKANSRLGEDKGIPDTRSMIQNLLNDHETIMENMHQDIKATDDKYDDAVTSNLLQDISAKHHKMAWMLRMILQRSQIDTVAVSPIGETTNNGTSKNGRSR